MIKPPCFKVVFTAMHVATQWKIAEYGSFLTAYTPFSPVYPLHPVHPVLFLYTYTYATYTFEFSLSAYCAFSVVHVCLTVCVVYVTVNVWLHANLLPCCHSNTTTHPFSSWILRAMLWKRMAAMQLGVILLRQRNSVYCTFYTSYPSIKFHYM